MQSPPGRGSEPCRFNPESRVTGVCVGALSVRFSLIVRLVREVIKIVWGVLARVLFGGFRVWNRGRFWGFLALTAKVRLGVLRVLFVVLVVVWSLIFCDFGKWGHFRSARSGVYMVSRRTDSVIRFGVLRFGWDAHFRYYSTAPPEHSLSRCSETAGEVWKGLGFGV